MIIRSVLRSSSALSSFRSLPRHRSPFALTTSLQQPLQSRRHYATKSDVDVVIDELQELYATAKDEVFPLLYEFDFQYYS